MEKFSGSKEYRLNAAYWTCLVLFGAASSWRLFLAIEKGLSVLAYLDYFLALAALVVASLQKNRYRNWITAGALVVVCVLTQVVNGGWSVNIGGMFLSGQPVLAFRHFADLAYYVVLLVTAVLLFLGKERASCFSSLAALVMSAAYSVSTMVVSTEYVGDFALLWRWYVENGLLIPTYFVVTFLLALTLFLFKYYDFTAPARRKRRRKLNEENKDARRRAE